VAQGALAFGPFELLRAQRCLLEEGRAVRLGSRALDLLIALVERAGEIVGTQELMACVWAREVVEENTLRVHMAALRKALGDGQPQRRFIVNLPGRGYCFVAAVTQIAHAPPPPAPPSARDHLPSRGVRPVGREGAITALCGQLRQQRFVSIVGPGGMGKTTVALAVAERLAPDFADGVCFVDLAAVNVAQALRTPQDVADLLATQLDLDQPHDSAAARVLPFLRERELLLVLDSCELVTAALAPLLESLLQGAPRLRVLATSREPVRAAGEWVHLLPALAFPRAPMGEGDPGDYPAMQLFAERANASDDGFQLSRENAPLVADICRRLDGVPLAIEMVAALVRVLGLVALQSRLDEQLLHLQGPQRQGVSRHETLKATFDWSHVLLTPTERSVLQRVAVFHGGVTMESALAVACDERLRRSEAREALANLVSKSWLQPDPGSDPVLFRLHGAARAYARERLIEAADEAQASGRHADHMRSVVAQAQEDWHSLAKPEWKARYAHQELDVRAAITWLMAQPGALPQATELVAQACMFAHMCSRFSEYRALVSAVLERLSREAGDPLGEMRMHQAMVMLQGPQFTPGSRSGEHKERALELAARYGGLRELIDAHMAQFIHAQGQGEHAEALAHAERLATVARDAADPVAILVSDRMRAQGHHFMGEHERSDILSERVLSHSLRRGRFTSPSGPVDHHVSIGILRVRAHWLRGQDDAATQLLVPLLARAEEDGPLSQAHAMCLAALPLAWWRGDAQTVGRLNEWLSAQSSRHPHGQLWGLWAPWVEAFGALQSLEGNDVACEALARETPYAIVADHLVSFDARCLHERALQRVREGRVGWCAPEVLRAEALRVLREGQPQAGARAEALLRESLALARRQGAQAWEQRAARSLDRLLDGRGSA